MVTATHCICWDEKDAPPGSSKTPNDCFLLEKEFITVVIKDHDETDGATLDDIKNGRFDLISDKKS